MKSTIYLFLFLFLGLALSPSLHGQGCVAIRQFSSCNGNTPQANLLTGGDWQLGINYRYFESFRHFRGTHEEPDRIANNTEVINWSHSWDISLTRGIGRQAYVSATLPFVLNTRSSLYEHGRTERHNSFSRGLADVRMGVGYWLFSPQRQTRGNLALGLGVKLPTGNYNASDIFYNVGPNGEQQVRPVDQSIQPGDGGFGITVDLQGYQQLWDQLYLYAGGFYLANPRETNGVRTFRETLSSVLQNEAIMSVPDQFAVRAGFTYSLGHALGISLGARYEGVPVEDIIGGSKGFRRPGNVLSVEPGISYMSAGGTSINLTVPFAVRRNRPQSLTDLETEQLTGTPRNGDAAFADYLVNLGVSFRLNRDHDRGMQPKIDFDQD